VNNRDWQRLEIPLPKSKLEAMCLDQTKVLGERCALRSRECVISVSSPHKAMSGVTPQPSSAQLATLSIILSRFRGPLCSMCGPHLTSPHSYCCITVPRSNIPHEVIVDIFFTLSQLLTLVIASHCYLVSPFSYRHSFLSIFVTKFTATYLQHLPFSNQEAYCIFQQHIRRRSLLTSLFYR
jgi:hypothetical protein